jgi:lipopolysaccharide biosynthesis glycosyltransferase
MSTNSLFKVFIGYDSREDIAYQVARHSLLRHTQSNVSVHPIRQESVRELGLYTRPVDATATTEFSLTRFLTPYLAAQAEGWVLFTDCDFLFTTDITNVLEGLDPTKAVYVVQHEYQPAHDIKMDGQKQTRYPRKNWSSFILFNLAHPDVQALTPEVVNSVSPAFLHRFQWVKDDAHIGSLELDWNFLEGEYERPEATPRVIHYTNGGPWFAEWQSVDFADLWLAEEAAYRASLTAKAA